jgi:glutamate dehydrogenase
MCDLRFFLFDCLFVCCLFVCFLFSRVEDGFKFRNSFHLHPLFTADVFVPCGGRPEAVNMSNIGTFEKVKDKNGNLGNRFKLIVEGANLFFTQEARLVLERNGVVLFKDASANKGGVTSSSCEVLSALCLNDSEHHDKMCEHDDFTPPFYEAYASQVQEKIEYNAIREFECMWNENARTKQSMSLIGDEISKRINTLSFSIRQSPLLWDDHELRRLVMQLAVPPLLTDFVGGPDKLVHRVPESYCKWIFSAFLASHYIYSSGLHTTEFTFMTFVEKFKADPNSLGKSAFAGHAGGQQHASHVGSSSHTDEESSTSASATTPVAEKKKFGSIRNVFSK